MADKLKFDVPLVLPEVHDAADLCVERLLAVLKARDGVDDAHIAKSNGDTPVLCVHFNPGTLSLPQVRSIVEAAGADISARFSHLVWELGQTFSARQANRISDQLAKTPGVLEAGVSPAGVVRVEFDRALSDEPAVRAALQRLGLRQRTKVEEHHAGHDHGPGEHGHDHDHGGIFGSWTELVFAFGSGLALAIGFAIEKLGNSPYWVSLASYIVAYGLGGLFTVREAFQNLKARRFEIDTLMLVAAVGAAALGAWAEGALLLFLFSLGHALEHYAMGRAKRAIEALSKLAPRTAMVRQSDGSMREMLVEELSLGDILVVKPDERIPADGFVTKGTSAVNQAPVTGESMPVDKRAVMDDAAARANPDRLDGACRVFAGTINGSGALEIEVTRLASESTLAKVIKLVSEAETLKSPTQRFTDKFERFFVPTVLGLTVLLLFAWVVVDEPFRASFYRAMAVLVAASPCALAIATPSAVLSGVARAARGGVLIKGGAPLELLGSLDAIAFDKTGTLTKGEPRIQEIVPAPGIDSQDLLAVAIAVESQSDHPLAQAIARDGKDHVGDCPIPEATQIESLTGRGVSAQVNGERVLIGKAEMFGADGIEDLSAPMADVIEKLRVRGYTTMVLRRGDNDLGAIGLLDTPRETARDALDRLRQLGIRRMVMLSGDHQRVADAVARQVGLDEAWGDLMPEDKVTTIRKLRGEAQVAMVGDGVNDAPAMASATVSIVMGAAGSDVALETADVALMADDLSHLPFAVGLSRQTRRIIRQNVFVSLGVVGLLVPATILGLGIGPAVAMHEGSTLIVVFNALRLLAYPLGLNLQNGFNGALAGKVLAIVDEINEGNSHRKHQIKEELKQLVTETERLINPKCARQFVEHNACRWLIFSNSPAALPLDDEDRRFNVVQFEGEPRHAEHYSHLYRLLDDQAFIGSIMQFLRSRDLSRFNPGERAPMTAAKAALLDRTRSDDEEVLRDLVERWPVDIITSDELHERLGENRVKGTVLRYALERAGIVKVGKWSAITDFGRKEVSAYALRNTSHWATAPTPKQKAEVARMSASAKECALYGEAEAGF